MRRFNVLLLLTLLGVWAGARPAAASPTDLAIYGDGLGSGWENWSWGSTINFTNPTPVHGGAASLAATYSAAWGGLYLHSAAPLAGGDYSALRFWLHGGSGGQRLSLAAADSAGDFGPTVNLGPLAAGWNQATITLAALGNLATITGFAWQDTTGGAQPSFYLDDIALVGANGPPPNQSVALAVDAGSGRHAINADIYGMNFADEALAAELRLPVNRWGGNSASRYNWQTSMTNLGSDWYFENIQNGTVNVANLPNGSTSDQFVEQNRRTASQSIITVPAIGWVAKADSPRSHPYDCGFKVSSYGAQQSADQWDPNCGNGRRSPTEVVTGNNPADTSQPIGGPFVRDWVNHLKGRYGAAAAGGVRYYALDNEPMLWHDTQRDIHPNPATYDEVRNAALAFAPAIKGADAGAQVLGPALWGWWAYFCSARDIVVTGACSSTSVDRAAHGGTAFIPWYLGQMKQYQDSNGTRILDYLDIHYYPQANGVALATAGSAATQQLRLRTTRSLWDSTYADESWVADVEGGKVQLIPRMKNWIASAYPGTKLAITEYNWGGMEHINGALAQADVLGIFGREGVDLATLWGTPAANEPGAFAFRMYRNYDGAGGSFGTTGVSAISTDQSRLAAYAAQRSADNALTVMVINKTAGPLTSAISLAGLTPGLQAQVYRYSAANLSAIARQPNLAVSASGLTASFPANSITLLVIPAGGPPRQRMFVPTLMR